MTLDSKFVKFIRGISTILILFYGVYFLLQNQNSFSRLLNIRLDILCLMIFFILINIFASAAENTILYKTLGAPIGNFESFGLTNVGAFFNLMFPQGGTITKAIYLRQRYGIPYTKTPTMYLGLLIIYMMVGAAVILVSNLVILSTGGSIPLIFWIAAGIGCVSGIFFAIDIPKWALTKPGKISTLISNFADGWNRLRTDRNSLLRAAIWQAIIFVSSGIWISAAFYCLNFNINPLLGLTLSVLLSFTNIFMILPGNLGIQEAVYGYFSLITGMTFAEGIVVSTLIRVVLLLVTLVLTPWSWYYLFYKKNIKINRQDLISNQ